MRREFGFTGFGIGNPRTAAAVAAVPPAEPEYGPELITNGDFSSDSGWTLDGATISGGALRGQGGFESAAREDVTLVVARAYEAVLVIGSMTTGTVLISADGGSSASVSTPGTHTLRLISGSGAASVGLVLDTTDAVIESFSLREPTSLGPELVSGGDFASGTGWTLAGTSAAISGGTFNAPVAAGTRSATRTADSALELSAYYRCVFTILNRTAGSGSIQVAGSATTPVKAADATYTLDVLVSALTNQNIAARISSNGAMEIDDVSVKKVLL